MAENSKSIITRPVIIATLAIGISLCCLTFFFQKYIFPNIIFETGNKLIVEITPVNVKKENQGNSLGNIHSSQKNEVTQLPGVFSIGMVIRVFGTGNEGLRMRIDAGIDKTTINLAQDDEQFKIIDGPEIKDSLIWWKIFALEDPEKTGWSVQDYMQAD